MKDTDRIARTVVSRARTIAALLAASLLIPSAASAQSVDLGMNYAGSMGLPSLDLRTVIADGVRSLLGFLGLFLVVQILWSGFLLMTSGGDSEAESAAKSSLKNAVLGFFLIMMSASITKFVVAAISSATGGKYF